MSDFQPLSNFPIVKEDGSPTEYFIQWAQQRMTEISDSVPTIREVIAGAGLDGGGALDADVTITLEDQTVTPAAYGDATHVARVTVNQKGVVTAISAVLITTPTLTSFTVATLPSASPAGKMIYVSNESGGAVPAFSDNTNWRRVTDRAIVS